jgi:HEAT repeat protein
MKDARAVEPLIAALKGADTRGRLVQIPGALSRINAPRTVELLIPALNDQDPGVRQGAAAALGGIRDPRTVELLIAALKDPDAQVRQSTAAALTRKQDPVADGVLTALRNRDLPAIAGAHALFIEWGELDSEDALIDALNQHGDALMALDFIASDNSKLVSAGREWAITHHSATNPPSFFPRITWGSRRE